MTPKRAAIAAILAVLVVVGVTVGAVQATTKPTKTTCHVKPVKTGHHDARRVKVVCKPSQPYATVTKTVTATATVTKTVTAMATVTAFSLASPTASALATQTPTQSASATAPATATPTASSTPTATSSPTSQPSGFPDATNTGVPAGTSLTAYTGPSNITTANTVISGKTIGCIQVSAPGVVIRNSKLSCKPTYAVVSVSDGAFTGTPLLLQDVEIDCQNTSGTAVGEAMVTVQRADIHGCENGFDANQAITVEDSYIHDLYNTSQSHTDGIQLGGGHWNGSAFVCCGLNVTIRHNTIYGVGADGSLGTSAIISNPKGDQNILIEDNLLAGGAYTLYCDYSGTATNYQVIDNHFSRKFSQQVGAYGPSDGCADETLSGNLYQESSTPVQLD